MERNPEDHGGDLTQAPATTLVLPTSQPHTVAPKTSVESLLPVIATAQSNENSVFWTPDNSCATHEDAHETRVRSPLVEALTARFPNGPDPALFDDAVRISLGDVFTDQISGTVQDVDDPELEMSVDESWWSSFRRRVSVALRGSFSPHNGG